MRVLLVADVLRRVVEDLHAGHVQLGMLLPSTAGRADDRLRMALPFAPQEREGEPQDPLFSTTTGRPLTRDAIAWLVTKYANIATAQCPTLKHKTVTPHVLRHSAAMNLLRAGCEATLLALWLGHKSVEATQVYIHADLTIKERALARTAPLDTTPGRYRPGDALLAFLESL